MRLNRDQCRFFLFVLNGILCLFFVAWVVYRVRDPYNSMDSSLAQLMDLDSQDFRRETARPPRVNYVGKLAGVGNVLAPRKPKEEVKPPAAEEETEDDFPGEVIGFLEDEPVYAGGPLEEEWEYTSCIYFGPDSPHNQAILQNKRSRLNRRRYARVTRARARARARARRSTRSRSLEPYHTLVSYERWEVREDGPVIWAVSISPERFVYAEEDSWKLFSLKCKEIERYATAGSLTSPSSEEGGEEGPQQQRHFILGEPPTLRDLYDVRHELYYARRGGSPPTSRPEP